MPRPSRLPLPVSHSPPEQGFVRYRAALRGFLPDKQVQLTSVSLLIDSTSCEEEPLQQHPPWPSTALSRRLPNPPLPASRRQTSSTLRRRHPAPPSISKPGPSRPFNPSASRPSPAAPEAPCPFPLMPSQGPPSAPPAASRSPSQPLQKRSRSPSSLLRADRRQPGTARSTERPSSRARKVAGSVGDGRTVLNTVLPAILQPCQTRVADE